MDYRYHLKKFTIEVETLKASDLDPDEFVHHFIEDTGHILHEAHAQEDDSAVSGHLLIDVWCFVGSGKTAAPANGGYGLPNSTGTPQWPQWNGAPNTTTGPHISIGALLQPPAQAGQTITTGAADAGSSWTSQHIHESFKSDTKAPSVKLGWG